MVSLNLEIRQEKSLIERVNEIIEEATNNIIEEATNNYGLKTLIVDENQNEIPSESFDENIYLYLELYECRTTVETIEWEMIMIDENSIENIIKKCDEYVENLNNYFIETKKKYLEIEKNDNIRKQQSEDFDEYENDRYKELVETDGYYFDESSFDDDNDDFQ
jgi:hypothetical protein